MLREKREKVQKDDGSIAARNVIARLGKAELRTDAGLREQVLDVLVSHRHLIPTARKGHYMMVVPHDLMVDANFANFANFWGINRGKLAKVANYAPTDKVNCQSAPGWPAVSITRI